MTHLERNLIDLDTLRLLTRCIKRVGEERVWELDREVGYAKLISARGDIMRKLSNYDLQDMLYEAIRQEVYFGGPK